LHRAVRTPQLHLAFGTRVVGYARKFLGTRYVYGGSSPRTGFDCSGLVRYVYGHFGLSLPHSSFAQFDVGRRVSRHALRPGDLLFFDGLGHVGMYVGNGRFIHAPHTGTRVRIEVLTGWYSSRFDGARRLRAAS
jgi:peptidoglycan DL-endopeptidase CwlO